MLRIKMIMSTYGVSRVTVYKWMSEGMPHIYVGKLLFFEEDKVYQWVQSHERD